MGDLRITALELGDLQTNCYLLTNVRTSETLIADPADSFHIIMEKCSAMGFKPVAALLTHGHFDHIMAAADVKGAFQIPIYAGIAEKALLQDARLNGSLMTGVEITLTADTWVSDGETLSLAGLQMKVICTPGHTAGSVCYYFEDENVLISGDTLFRGSFGRTDFPTGSFPALAQSITGKLFSLPDATQVYPGHGARTTIANEKKNNMIVRAVL